MASSVTAPDPAVGRLRYLRELGLPTLFGAVVLLGSATLLLFANVSALRGSLRSIEHSQQVLAQIADLEGGIMGDELSVRGYALTGDPRFVTFQKNERAKCDAARVALLRLVPGEPLRATEYSRVMQDVAWHMTFFGQLSGVGPDNAQVVARAIVDPVIRSNMRKTRNGLAALRKQEMSDLGDRQRLMADQITRAFVVAAGLILVAFVLSGLGIWAARLQSPIRFGQKS